FFKNALLNYPDMLSQLVISRVPVEGFGSLPDREALALLGAVIAPLLALLDACLILKGLPADRVVSLYRERPVSSRVVK
ncbi:unnamed protein product, partial [marine sediment metagenome]